jgi:hypothetical protein
MLWKLKSGAAEILWMLECGAAEILNGFNISVNDHITASTRFQRSTPITLRAAPESGRYGWRVAQE